MLPCLGHDAFVRRHHKEHHIHAHDAGHHVVDEFLVARHVDDAGPVPARQVKPGKAEVDGDAAALLLLPPVRVAAREGFDQGRLPVVDVARCPYDNVFHGSSTSPSFSSRAARAASSSGTVRMSEGSCR